MLLTKRRLSLCGFTFLTGLSVLIAGCRDPAWREFASAELGFTVSFPGTPQEKNDSIETSIGQAQARVFSVEIGRYPWQDRIGFYSVSVADMPNGLPAEKLMIERQKAQLEALGGTVVKASQATLGKAPGVEFEVARTGNTNARGRIFIANGHIYELLVAGEQQRVHAESDGERFLNSFSLKQ